MAVVHPELARQLGWWEALGKALWLLHVLEGLIGRVHVRIRELIEGRHIRELSRGLRLSLLVVLRLGLGLGYDLTAQHVDHLHGGKKQGLVRVARMSQQKPEKSGQIGKIIPICGNIGVGGPPWDDQGSWPAVLWMRRRRPADVDERE